MCGKKEESYFAIRTSFSFNKKKPERKKKEWEFNQGVSERQIEFNLRKKKEQRKKRKEVGGKIEREKEEEKGDLRKEN